MALVVFFDENHAELHKQLQLSSCKAAHSCEVIERSWGSITAERARQIVTLRCYKCIAPRRYGAWPNAICIGHSNQAVVEALVRVLRRNRLRRTPIIIATPFANDGSKAAKYIHRVATVVGRDPGLLKQAIDSL